MTEQPEERATDRPEVVTAPAEPRRRSVPAHLGPARTSTVVLSVLFLAIGFLYLNVRPEPVPTTQTGGGSDVEQPAVPTTTAVPPTTTTPPTTTAPPEPTTTEPAPAEPTTSDPTATTTPEVPGDTTTPPVPTSEPPAPPSDPQPGG